MNTISVNSKYPEILTADHIAEILDVSKPTAYVVMEEISFPLIRIGRCKRVFRDDFYHWLSQKKSA